MVTIIPVNNIPIQNLDESQQPSLTWRINFESGRIAGKFEGLESVRQAVYKILITKRFSHLIYSVDYGQELKMLIGKDAGYLVSEVQRIIIEALSQDDRILSIENMDVQVQQDTAIVKFVVVCIFGDFEVDQEVRF